MLKVAWSEIYNHPLPKNHRFPMVKYDLIPEQLLYEGTLSPDNLFTPGPLDEHEILTTHKPFYWDKLKHRLLSAKEERRTGFPLSENLVNREIIIMEGTLTAALQSLKSGIGMNIAGGTHHAFSDKGEGFCLLNDIAIAANHLLNNGICQKILIVDLDVHQGNGTAEIFRDHRNVFTFSMHGAKNYPLSKEQSDLDVALPDNTGDRTYLRLLESNLSLILDAFQPQFVFFQSGVDVLKTDKLGRLGLSREGCKTRDAMVLNACKRNNIPVTVSMGGGYSEKLSDIVEAHANTFRLAQEIYF